MLSPVLAHSVGLAHSSPLPSVHSGTEIGERIPWDPGKVYSSLLLQQHSLEHQEALRLTLAPTLGGLDHTRSCTVLPSIQPGFSLSQDSAVLTPAQRKGHTRLLLIWAPTTPWTGLQSSPSDGTGVSEAHLGLQWLAHHQYSVGVQFISLPLQLFPSSAHSPVGAGYSSPICRHHLFLPGLQPRAQIHNTSWVGLKLPLHRSRPHVGAPVGLGSDLKLEASNKPFTSPLQFMGCFLCPCRVF